MLAVPYRHTQLAGANAKCLSFALLAGALVDILVRKARHYQFRKPRFLGAGFKPPAGRGKRRPYWEGLKLPYKTLCICDS